MVLSLSAVDWSAEFAQLDLPRALKDAVIVHKGDLTPSYRHLEKYLRI
jgi:hypothetical protein